MKVDGDLLLVEGNIVDGISLFTGREAIVDCFEDDYGVWKWKMKR